MQASLIFNTVYRLPGVTYAEPPSVMYIDNLTSTLMASGFYGGGMVKSAPF